MMVTPNATTKLFHIEGSTSAVGNVEYPAIFLSNATLVSAGFLRMISS